MMKSAFVKSLLLGIALGLTATSCGGSNEGGDKPKTDTVVKADTTPRPQPVVINRELTDAARLMAGYEVDSSSPLNHVQQTAEWKRHRDSFQNTWNKLDGEQFNKIRTWASKVLDPMPGASRNIFYPFSGPDFIYINTLFPNANSYSLTGLEPVGDLPELGKLNPTQLNASFVGLANSLDDILGYSFFRTNSMKGDFTQNQLKGLLPVLMVFLAQTNHEIIGVTFVGMEKTGGLRDMSPADFKKMTDLLPGVRIDFVKKGSDQARKLFYFSGDISDEGLKLMPEYVAYVKSLGHPITYLKAASYLMHRETFSTIRNTILEESVAVLQDDSGMPVRHFMNDSWQNTFYGAYTTPIPLFSSRFQADLRKIYVEGKDIQPLDFGIGYQFRPGTSNLQLAVKVKDVPKASDAPEATPEKSPAKKAH